MAHEAEDLQYAVDIMRISMEKVLEKDPSGRMVLLHAIEVVLASPHTLQRQNEEDEMSISTVEKTESLESIKDVTPPMMPTKKISKTGKHLAGTDKPAVSFQDAILDLSRSVTPKKKRARIHSPAPTHQVDPFVSPGAGILSPNARRTRSDEKNKKSLSGNKARKAKKT